MSVPCFWCFPLRYFIWQHSLFKRACSAYHQVLFCLLHWFLKVERDCILPQRSRISSRLQPFGKVLLKLNDKMHVQCIHAFKSTGFPAGCRGPVVFPYLIQRNFAFCFSYLSFKNDQSCLVAAVLNYLTFIPREQMMVSNHRQKLHGKTIWEEYGGEN